MPLPKRMPSTPPSGRQEHGLEEELPQDLAPARAERLADADLARALGDRDRHDAMTPMPPTISAIDESTTSARKMPLADLLARSSAPHPA